MNEPSLKKPTKKTFHFPKSATAEASADANQTDAVVEVTAKPEKTKTAAAPKVSRRKSAEKAAAPKSEAAVKEKAAPKTEAVAKEKAAPKAKAAPKQKAAPKEKVAEASVAAVEKPKRAKKETAKKVVTTKEVVAKKEVAKKEVAKKEVAKKEKVVRDSFTMPKSDYAKIAALKQKCLDAGISVKKSEVLRAGLLLLEGATSQRLLAAISAVEAVKTGRPSKS